MKSYFEDAETAYYNDELLESFEAVPPANWNTPVVDENPFGEGKELELGREN